MLEIKNLHVAVDGKEILKGVNLHVLPGEVHAIMGPNGSGKSTLANVLAGRDGYVVTAGEINYLGRDLTALTPEERAREGVLVYSPQSSMRAAALPGSNGSNFRGGWCRSEAPPGIEAGRALVLADPSQSLVQEVLRFRHW